METLMVQSQNSQKAPAQSYLCLDTAKINKTTMVRFVGNIPISSFEGSVNSDAFTFKECEFVILGDSNAPEDVIGVVKNIIVTDSEIVVVGWLFPNRPKATHFIAVVSGLYEMNHDVPFGLFINGRIEERDVNNPDEWLKVSVLTLSICAKPILSSEPK